MGTRSCSMGIMIFVALLVASQTAHARGLLGERYFAIGLSGVRASDERLRDKEGFIEGLNAEFNIPITPFIDIAVMYSHVNFDSIGVDNDTYGLGLIAHARPERDVDPFLTLSGGIIRVYDDSNPTFSITGGTEIDLTERAAARVFGGYAVVFVDKDIENTGQAGIDLNVWLHEHLFAAFDAALQFKKGGTSDLSLLGSIGIGF